MMRTILLLAVSAAGSATAATGIYAPTVIHRTQPGPAVLSPAAPAQPAGVTSLAPSVVLGWGGLPPSSGQPPVYSGPVQPYPVQPVYPGYPGYAVQPGYPVQPYYYPGQTSRYWPGMVPAPVPAPGHLHHWGPR